MNKYIDHEIYYELCEQLADEATVLHRRQILPTRMLKLSLPDRDITYGIIGAELLSLGQFQKSIFPLKRATILNPHNFGAQRDLVKALFGLEKENEAFDCIKKALSFNLEDNAYHELLITELQKRDRLGDLEAFSGEIADRITDPKSISNFYFEFARTLLSLQMFPQALLIFRKVMKSNPPMRLDDHYHYGGALYHGGFFEEALAQFEQVKKLKPSMRLAWTSAAYMNYCLGRVQEAREEFECIMQSDLETNLTYSNFLLVLLHLDEDKELINQFKRYLEQSLVSSGNALSSKFNIDLKITQALLDRDDIDGKTREFNVQKLKAINSVLSFITEKMAILNE